MHKGVRAGLTKPGWLCVPVLLCVGCHPKPALRTAIPAATSADSLALVSVVQSDGDRLKANVPAELLITLQYTLSTRDRGFLVLEMDQFSNHETCIHADGSSVPANRRETVASDAAHITFGTHTVQFRMVWPGGKNQHGLADSGAVSFHASMRSEDAQYDFLTYRFGTQYCMRF